MLEGDRIEDIYYAERRHGLNKYYLTAIYRRDKERQRDAEFRAKLLTSSNGWLPIQQLGSPDQGLYLHPTICRETIDLMHYLTDLTFYNFHAHFDMDGELWPPFCGDPMYWHSTQQGKWRIASPISDAADNQDHQSLDEFATR